MSDKPRRGQANAENLRLFSLVVTRAISDRTWSQNKLAREAALDSGYVSKLLEHAKLKKGDPVPKKVPLEPNIGALMRICSALGIDPSAAWIGELRNARVDPTIWRVPDEPPAALPAPGHRPSTNPPPSHERPSSRPNPSSGRG